MKGNKVMEKDLVSIIVPVYNGEAFFKRCLNSLFNQTYKKIEIIVVNDGSKDNSKKILNECSKNDSRLKIINQKNSGVSVARNRGISEANGEYLMFVDADDWISLETVETCIKEIKENSLVRFMMQYADDDALLDVYPCIYNDKNETVSSKQLFEDIISYKVGGHCVYYLYRADIIKNNKIIFPIEIKYCEDLCFVLNVLKHSQTVKIIPNAFYKYYTNFNSATLESQSKIRNLQSLPKLRKKVIEIFPAENKQKYINLYNQTLLSLLLDYYSNFSNLNYKEFKRNVKEIDRMINPMIKEIGENKFNIKWRVFIKLNILNWTFLLYIYMKIYRKVIR